MTLTIGRDSTGYTVLEDGKVLGDSYPTEGAAQADIDAETPCPHAEVGQTGPDEFVCLSCGGAA